MSEKRLEQMWNESQKKRNKNRSIIFGIVFVAIAVMTSIGIYNSPANRLARQLDLGQKYLEDLDYEQALVEFDKAIAIDPMNVEAYMGKTQAYVGMDDTYMVLQTLEDGLEYTGNEQIKDRLIEEYLELAKENIEDEDYEKALEIYDNLLELDIENEMVQSDAEGCIQEYLDLLVIQKRYDEISGLIEKYQEKVEIAGSRKIITEIKELERAEAKNRAFMQKVYELMMMQDWQNLHILDETEEMISFVEQMEDDRYLFFVDGNTAQTGNGVGIYKDNLNHYFYFGDYVNAMRSGNGIYYETNTYGSFDLFLGVWKEDAPNGQGKLSKNIHSSGVGEFYDIVVEGNYVDGLSDGYMSCILVDPEYGAVDLSYMANNGTPEDITDMVHQKDSLTWKDNYIYAYEEYEGLMAWYLSLDSRDDKLGVFGFEIRYEKSWKDAYIEYINEKKYNWSYYDNTDNYLYRLINIDNDDIPELYIDYSMTATGAVLCSFYEGSIIEQPLWTFGLSYIEGQNLFMDSGGHMDSFYNLIYCIRNGKFVLLYEGQFGASDNANVQYDMEGNPIYSYLWCGNQIATEAEYHTLLNAVYDTRKSIKIREGLKYDESWNLVGSEFRNYEEIIEIITDY